VRHIETIGGRHQLGHRVRRIARDHEQRALARVGEVERRLKDPHRQRLVADRLGPLLVLRLQVEEVPRSTAERKDLGTSAKTLISRDGLSTAQTCPCCSVARACG
jgi:hypothetical protein